MKYLFRNCTLEDFDFLYELKKENFKWYVDKIWGWNDNDQKKRLKQDLVAAMKQKDKQKLEVIRMVKAAVDLEHINTKREITDDLILDVLNKQIKMRNDSIAEFQKANRNDLVEKTKKEVEILMTYMPEQLSKEEVNKIIAEIFELLKPEGNRDMGKVMREATARLKGKADMKEVSVLIKERLS